MQPDGEGYMQTSRYQWNKTEATPNSGEYLGDFVFLRNGVDNSCTYPMGVDPIWGITSNKLQFINGIKMKVSVIMAIFHMSIGIIMKGTNSVYFNKPWDLITEVIFGLIIFWGLFGWMDTLIIAKWFNHINIEDVSDAPDVHNGINRLYYETDDEEQIRLGTNY